MSTAVSVADRRFAVMVETHEGTTHALRYFGTRSDAEAHPVKLAQWKRCWIIKLNKDYGPSPRDHFPPLPWSVSWSADSRVTYLKDAEGHTIATLLGTRARRLKMQAYLETLRP